MSNGMKWLMGVAGTVTGALLITTISSIASMYTAQRDMTRDIQEMRSPTYASTGAVRRSDMEYELRLRDMATTQQQAEIEQLKFQLSTTINELMQLKEYVYDHH